MTRTAIDVATPDGTCPVSLFHPEPVGDGQWPAVLVYMDALGVRPALFDIAERIARAGYLVLLPDLFYRTGPVDPAESKRMLFGGAETRRAFLATHVEPLTVTAITRDTAALLEFLAARPDVLQPLVGTTGYCMGGRFSLAAAATFPERVAAAAAFHGSWLVTDAPDSPHRLAPRMRARVYIAGAVEDPSFTDDMKAELEQALTAAGVEHTVETYPARHGWVPADTPMHDPAAAERHFESLLALFAATLRG
jgi:carboxymethylenebutenolidase